MSEPDYVAVALRVHNPVTATATGGEIWLKAGPVTLYLDDARTAQMIGALEQARRELAEQRGQR